MSVVGDQPVMWVNTKTLLYSGPCSDNNMKLWNRTLEESCGKYPNMRIFDWASAAREGWFISDGTHFTSAGYAQRARLTAKALAQAFPASGQKRGPSCVVQIPDLRQATRGLSADYASSSFMSSVAGLTSHTFSRASCQTVPRLTASRYSQTS